MEKITKQTLCLMVIVVAEECTILTMERLICRRHTCMDSSVRIFMQCSIKCIQMLLKLMLTLLSLCKIAAY